MSIAVKTGPSTKIQMMRFKNLSRDVKEQMKTGFEKLGSTMVRTAENQALQPKYGRTYFVKGKRGGRVKHIASAPKQSPAILSGNYFENFKFESHGWQSLEFGNDAEYSGYLEFGVKKGESKYSRWRLAPRPGVQNAVNENIRNARMILETEIGKNFEL